MKKEKVSCKKVMSHICKSLNEDLDSPKCKAIKDHLDACPDCRNYFKTVEMTIDFYKKYDVELPPGAHDHLMNFLGMKEE